MTPLPVSPLVTAWLELLRATIPTCPIYLAKAAVGALPPFAVIYPDTGMLSTTRRTLANNGPNELRWQITSVGATPEQTLWVADKTSHAALTGIPVVPGRRVWPTVEEGSQQVQPDHVSIDLFFATAQYLTRSDPA